MDQQPTIQLELAYQESMVLVFVIVQETNLKLIQIISLIKFPTAVNAIKIPATEFKV